MPKKTTRENAQPTPIIQGNSEHAKKDALWWQYNVYERAYPMHRPFGNRDKMFEDRNLLQNENKITTRWLYVYQTE